MWIVKGGAIYIKTNNAQFNLYDSSFKGNKAKYDGALYVETNSTNITIDKCLFTENEALSVTTYQSNGNAIIWDTKNDNGNNVIKNSIFLNNGYDKSNMQYTFLLMGGDVNIDYNFWGTYSQNPQDFSYRFVGVNFAPNYWLFLNYDISSETLDYNETATIKYFIQAHNGTQAFDFDYTKLPDISFDVRCDKGELDKNTVSLNEEFTYRATDAGVAKILNSFNNYDYEISINGPYMIPISCDTVILYAGQGTGKNSLIETANGNYDRVTVTCNDSSIINLYGEEYEITAKATEGTAKLTFSYNGYYPVYPFAQNLDVIVKVVKVPLNISVTNIEGNEITLTVSDKLDLNIAFEIDEIHKDYASPYCTMDEKYDSSVISFSTYSGFKPENGSFYPIGYITAISGGTTYLTLYSTSDKFVYENYTLKITVNKIPTSITVGDKDSFKVDDIGNINASFFVNGTQSTGALIYESSNENVVNFTSDAGDFKATGNGTAVLTVRFAGNSTHESSSKSITVTVSKIETQITAEDKVLNSTDENIEIGASVNVTGEYHLDYSSGNESVVTVSADGKLTAIGGGQAHITIRYAGTEKYMHSTKTITVTVKKLETRIVAEKQIQTNYNKTISINPTVVNVNGTKIDEGTVLFFIGEESISDPFTVDRVGRFNITVRYSENPRYKASELNVTVISDKANNSIVVSVDDAVYPKVTVKVTADQDDNYTVDINGTPVKVEVVNGEGWNMISLPAGSYYANITGYTSPFFNGVTTNDTFTVAQADSSVGIHVLNGVVYVGEPINVEAVVPVGATGNVTFRLTGNKTVNIGEVATFDGLTLGTYRIYAIYNGDNNYKASKEANVTIHVKYDINLSIAADDINYGEDLVVKVSTNSNFTGDVLVKIAGLNQTAHITDGVGNATFANLAAAKYFITASSAEDDTFHAGSANATATVKGVVVPADKAFNINVPANSKSPTFSIKLDRDATGNFAVSIDNGKIVRTVALKDGSASITVNNLAAGKHQVTISYSGDGKYAPITKSTTLTIKEPAKPKVTKKATKIVVKKKKTFKAKTKVKKYIIKLKSGKKLVKKVKVTIKVKGKTYKAKTNSKGKATFKIIKLKKKGKYRATIRFKGNAYYKPSTKKVRIIIK